ncbi:bifunctional UDP-N-acetylmuramoyl-tripeptide:D-alanyl-D-alanine ligase/alanine racemase [Tellurirhabdus bombi]|uniref:bifunctional UDP-N-acetylmuramoyl-tripeptide:D-alanyl-D-alanine ligase/alanine racemase n=1 Tax=Tellurirhabdus bombi TaxID=2907205 RepID=UPI001F3417E7|nr:bifunctional UDP-N-acetylmuramoyl-tripeptide:D-alanyl-D-alanine ligase/alanine racemase [Tellurirhabdus bombi]
MNILFPEINSAALYPVTDSRQVLFPAQSIFFAIRGERHDGHRYITELYQKGVRHFVVESAALTPAFRDELAQYADAQILEVGNSLEMLQKMAADHRRQFVIPVIGVTGSNGKTIVKEWLTQILEPDFRIQKSPKSYNSQVGVPLSVWPLKEEHTLGIFEAGISKPFEMQALQGIIRPTIGIFTNIGSAHDEGFRSRKQKVAEKLRLFTQVKTLIYRKDYPEIDEEINLLLKAVNPDIQLISWSSEGKGAVNVTYEAQASGTLITLKWAERDYSLFVPFADEASLENATHTALATLVLGITDEATLQSRFARLRPVSMRLEVKEGIHRNLLIDDTYNNDLAGLSMALNFLSQQDSSRQKVLILSDLLETGLGAEDLYPIISQLVAGKGVHHLIAVGPELGANQRLFPEGTRFYPTAEELVQSNYLNTLYDAVILVKGARRFGFERIINRLIQKSHQTVLEVNLDALTHNLNYYRSKVGAKTKIMAMVKAFAYGSGSAEVARLLQYHRVDYLAVAYADEGVALRQHGIHLPIMVMNPSPETFAQLLEYRLEPEIYSFWRLEEWKEFLMKEAKKGKSSFADFPSLHLKLDTGMHRLGFLPDELAALCTLLQTTPTLRVASVFSHLAGADEAAHNGFSQQQYEQLARGAMQLEEALGYQPIRHILNSAGIIRFPEYKLDMVRLGIGLYGVEASQLETGQVLPVGTLKTVISQIKNLKAGETVGYSRRGLLQKDARIATIAIGYADGYDRRLGNGVGHVSVNGTLCPTVGSICMDMTMIDVTEADAQEADEVIVFGKEMPITRLAACIGTIPYEIITGVSERVKRIFYRE